MPYIVKRRREYFDVHGLTQLCGAIKDSSQFVFSAGDLAYIVYKLLLAVVPRGARFHERSEMMAAVDEAKMEYRRRIHEPAEDQAIVNNGDIE